MSERCVRFHSPASKETINYLVVEYLKYILYYRGQFPLPLDQLKRTIKTIDKSEAIKIGDQIIYYDGDDQSKPGIPNTKKSRDRLRQVFVDSVIKFDKFFDQLLIILQNEEVLEVVMNLGPNMMSPKELHRITLPKSSSDSQYNSDASRRQYRLEFFKTLMHSAVLQDVNLDNPIPISVLLRLKDGVSLKEYMEQKRFYTPPQKCKQVIVRFDDEVVSELQCFQEMTLNENTASSEKCDLWVKLKSELKGFKDISEAQTTPSSNNFF